MLKYLTATNKNLMEVNMKKRVFFKSAVAFLLAAIIIASGLTGLRKVMAAENETVRVSTAKQLNAAVKNPDVGTIIFRTNANIDVTIKANSGAKSKYLVIDSPSANITNKAVFEYIYIRQVGDYIENASGNSFEIHNIIDNVSSFTIAKKKTVNELNLLNIGKGTDIRYSIRKGAKIKTINLIDTNGDYPSYSTYNSKKRTLDYDYYPYNGMIFHITFKLDKSGRILSAKCDHEEFDFEYNYSYDSNGYLTGYSSTSGFGKEAKSYVYNPDHLLLSETHSYDGIEDEIIYDYKKQKLIGEEFFDGSTQSTYYNRTYSYDDGRITKITTEYYVNDGTVTSVIEFTYNSKGFLTKYVENQPGDICYEITFKYNKAGDQITETILYNSGEKRTSTFEYDELGNRIE